MTAPIARYFASLGVEVDRKSVALVDSTLNRLQQKIRNFGRQTNKDLRVNFDISKFNVDQRKLNMVLGNALDVASLRTTFEITNFQVNQAMLNQSVSRAVNVAERMADMNVNVRARAVPGADGGISTRHAVAAGGIGGIAARAYLPALALAGGGYGAGFLNRRNQEVVSAQLMTQAVVQQAGGTAQEGTQSFDWLRGQADRVGFNYLEAAPDFNKLISGLTGAGMSVGTSQETFRGFAELSRVNKLDKTSQNRLFRALSQVAGKNQLMSEELTGQIAEALPGGVALFAEAWQRKTGGNLTGSDSIKALREAMEKKQVKGDILPIAALIASEKAASGLSAASQASQAEQARMKNALNNQAIIASQNGIESGFSKIFRAAAIGLSESNNLTKSLAQSFDVAATFAERLILFPQSFARALDGRDSLVAEWLGVGATEDLREDWATIKALIDSIFSMEVPSWMVTFESTAKEIAMLLGKLAEFQQFKQRTSTAAEQIIADEYYAGGGSFQSQIKGIAKANWHTFKNVFTGSSDDSAQYLAQRDAYNGTDISPYMDERGFNPMSYWKGQEQRSRDYAMDAFGEGGLSISRKTAGTYIAESRNENKIDVKIILQGGDTEENRSYFKNDFRKELDTALLNFGQTE
jgi:hypothetical protein